MARFACLCLASALVAASSTAPDPAPVPPTGKYRLLFTKTYGDDHFCLTELGFRDDNQNPINANLTSMSSCYGCSACAGCVHRYGNPMVLFDGDATSDSPAAWSCTAPGTFVDGVGSQQIVFTLSARPTTYVLQRPQVNGDWVNREWSFEEELADGNWQIIDSAADVVRTPDQWRNVSQAPKPITPPPGAINPPWSYATPESWVENYPSCAGKQQSPIDLDAMSNMGTPGDAKLPYTYQAMTGRALANTGSTLQLAGDLGNLTLPGGIYVGSQFHFHFPAEHRIGGDEHLAIGELQIIHQKVGARMADDVAIVSIMLHLPEESETLRSQEQFFIDMGMLAIPDEAGKYSQPLTKSLDLGTALADSLNGNFWQYTGSLATPPCTEGVQYFVMETPALISGVVVQQFKNIFPDPANARPIQKTNGRTVSVNVLPAAAVAESTAA